jgi:predicted phosphodiesterase
MKYALMADIHANLEALEAVLRDSKEQGCTHYAFLGDFVGYCADPKACLEIVRAMNAPCVKGNHDEYCATNLPLTGFNPELAKAVIWTREQLSEDHCRWLTSLEHVRRVKNFTIVHGSLETPERWEYVFDRFGAAASFQHQKTQLCFFGHTHVPVAFVRDGMILGDTYSKLRMERGKQYFVNVGSVGQPRDGNLNAAYVVHDIDNGTIELRRVEYDITETQRKIREAGLGG